MSIFWPKDEKDEKDEKGQLKGVALSKSHPLVASLMDVVEWGVKDGHLRQLDWALVRFFCGLQIHLNEAQLFPLLWLIAVMSQYQAQGHTCVSLRSILAKETDLFRAHQVQKSDFLRLHYVQLSEHLPKNLDQWMDIFSVSDLVKNFKELPLLDHVRDADDNVQNTLISQSPQTMVIMTVERDVLVYFRRQWMAEDFIARALYEKSRIDFQVDEEQLKVLLNLLFEAPDEGSFSSSSNSSPNPLLSKGVEIDWQKIACALSVKSPLSVITGGPGTGKTYTVSRLIALASLIQGQERPLRMALAAPTGKAASRLYRSIESSLLTLSDRLRGRLDTSALLKRIGAAKTLHTLLGYQMRERRFRYSESKKLPLDLLVLDEASMIDAELMCSLLRALSPQTTLILLGDKDQLSSVEAGSILAELSGHVHPSRLAQLGDFYQGKQVEYLCRVTGLSVEEQTPLKPPPPSTFNNWVMLNKSRRFEGYIAELAQAINWGDQEGVSRVLIKGAASDMRCISSEKMEPLLEVCLGQPSSFLAKGQSADLFADEAKPNFLNYLSILKAKGALSSTLNPSSLEPVETWIGDALLEFERFRVLCAINEGPLGSVAINQAIERRLQKEGWIQTHGEWYSGRAIMLTRNQHDLGLSNGDVGLVVRDPPSKVDATARSYRAYFLAGSGFQSVSVNRLLSVQTAYAMSIHKAQGSEYQHALVVLQDHAERSLTRELLYTGVTRAKKYLTLFQAKPGLIEQAVTLRSKRTSGLSSRLQQLADQPDEESLS